MRAPRISPRTVSSLGFMGSNLTPKTGCATSTAQLPRRRDHDVAVFDRPVIPLQEQRPRLAFVAVERATGDSRNLLIADHLSSIRDYGHHSPDQRDVVRLPFTRRSRRHLARRNESIDPAEPIVPGLVAEIVLDLHLVPPAEIHATVAFLRVAELDVKLEILELAIRHEIGPRSRTAQHTVGDVPLIRWPARVPATQIICMQQSDRRAPQRF